VDWRFGGCEKGDILKLRVERDTTRPLGYARIAIEGVSVPPDARKFVFRREGYQEANLGLHGWQVREEQLEPIEVTVENGVTYFVVGPAVTRHLEPMAYLFLVVDTKVNSFVFWPDDIDYFDGTLQKRVEPIVQPDNAAPAAPQGGSDANATATGAADGKAGPGQDATDAGSSRRKPLLLALLAACLLAGAAGTWWAYPLLVPPRSETSTASTTPPSAPAVPTPPAGPTPVGVSASPPGTVTQEVPPAPVWPDGTDQLDVREVVGRAPNASAILAVALRRQAAGKFQDALLLFEEAADRGDAHAMTALARLYDPNGFVPGRPFLNPDGRTAADYYKRAVEKGDAAAVAPRAALRTTLEMEARNGNGSAAAALKESWP